MKTLLLLVLIFSTGCLSLSENNDDQFEIDVAEFERGK